MSWRNRLFDELSNRSPGGYAPSGPAASEPTALAALAFATAGRTDSAVRCANWLLELQGRDGTVGIMPGHPIPAWPTSLAMLAWQRVDPDAYGEAIARAATWAIGARGTTVPRSKQFGHDTTLAGWPWADGTHSWLEPTAFFVMALRAAGYDSHPRTREGVRILVDRMLPNGGCNYGNTLVLGQQLLPHVQPTGIALWALGGEKVSDRRIELSLDFLRQRLNSTTATSSLCFGLLGLLAHGHRPIETETWLEAALRREHSRETNCYKLALLALAAATASPSFTNDTLRASR